MSQTTQTSLRSVGIALIVFGLLLAMSPAMGLDGLRAGLPVIGLSLYLAALGAKRGWRYCPIAPIVIGLLVGGTIITRGFIFTRPTLHQRARAAKAQADTRALASAIRDFAAHCGALPVGGTNATTNCSATTHAASGPAPPPSVLLTRQTNAKGEIRGPFIHAMPALPAGWSGSGNSYSYHTFAAGTFTVCATADGTGANSNGGTSCP